jgi:hypothetical protein
MASEERYRHKREIDRNRERMKDRPDEKVELLFYG